MKSIVYRPHGVCSSRIEVSIDKETIADVRFTGGCSGNTQGVATLVKGMNVNEAIKRLRGIRCGFKTTSCPDQLADALEACMALSDEEGNV